MITTSEWGFILMEFIIVNGLVWLHGFDLELKEKIIIPNVIMLAIIGLMIAFKLMGVEK